MGRAGRKRDGQYLEQEKKEQAEQEEKGKRNSIGAGETLLYLYNQYVIDI